MTNPQRSSLSERNIDQAITVLKRGSYLLKYGRKGKPKFCPFRLTNDEKTLVWYIGNEEKQLRLIHVSGIVPGQRTPLFLRYPRPEKEYQSFSVLYGKQSLDLICKDKDEADIWFIALRALISKVNCQKWRSEINTNNASSNFSLTDQESQSIYSGCSSDAVSEDSRLSQFVPSLSRNGLGRALSDLVYNATVCSRQRDFGTIFQASKSFKNLGDLIGWSSAGTSRVGSSSALSSTTSHGSFFEDLDIFDLYLWGEGTGDALLGGGVNRIGEVPSATADAFLPKALESTLLLDIDNVACGSKHAVLVTKQGQVFSWGDGSGGRLGHGLEIDICNPKPIDSLSGLSTASVACGDYHTCAITVSGDLYSWGDGKNNVGLLGHGNEISYWTPKKLACPVEDVCISSISCGPWHSAAITSLGKLFTFGDGSFGALGHGDCSSSSIPREVETLKGHKTIMVSCGFWHTAAVVDVMADSACSGTSSEGRLYTWGSGDNGQLGHGDKASKLTPCWISSLRNTSFCKVACGHSLTVALTTSGKVYTMGKAPYGQLDDPRNTWMFPTCVEGKIKDNFIEDIACGSFHIAALSSKSDVYTWGKGKSGQLGHGDNKNRSTPTLVEALKNKQVKEIACGKNFTAAICLHKGITLADHSTCSGCSRSFNIRRKRHNCYNCGLCFCKGCTSKKSGKASLAPIPDRPYRVCEDCFNKLNNVSDTALNGLPPRVISNEGKSKSSDELMKEKVSMDSKQHGLLSKLSSLRSLKRSEVWCSVKKKKPNAPSRSVSPVNNGSHQYARSYNSSSSRSIFDFSERVSTSHSGSTIHSRAASSSSSPISFTSCFNSLSLPQAVDDTKQRNDLEKEISFLREQVAILSSRSNFLASELEKKSSQMNQIMEVARDHAARNSAARQLIETLMKQMKDMTAKLPAQPSSCRTSDPFADNSSSFLSMTST